MSKKPCVVGIDVGTSSCKTLAIDEYGEVITSSSAEYPVYTPFPGWSEQDPLDWWDAVKSTFREVATKVKEQNFSIEGIGLTGQMHSLVAIDGEGRVLRRAILWNDQRSALLCEKIHEIVGGKENFLKITNNVMLPGYTGSKILWLKEEEPERFSKVKKFLCPKDFIRFKLTGKYVMDVTDASGTGLFDVKNRKWNKDLITTLGLPFSIFPETCESHVITGFVKKDVCKEFGIEREIPVVGGGGDIVVQTIGVGAVNPDTLCIILGTAGVVSASLDKFFQNPGGTLQLFCNVMPNKWFAAGVTLAAGGSLRWARDVFADTESVLSRWTRRNVYDFLSEEAEISAPTGRGLIFLPFLNGERCPYNDPTARGVFVGLSSSHTRNDFLRSIFEGIVFSLKDAYGEFEKMGLDISQVRLSGGGAQSKLFRQLHANIFGREVVVTSQGEAGGSYGAAILAGVGVGFWSSVEEAVATIIKITDNIMPDSSESELYKNFFEVYKDAYSHLKEVFYKLVKFQNI